VSDTWFCQAGNVPNVELFVHVSSEEGPLCEPSSAA
jgi:hypothetical protein